VVLAIMQGAVMANASNNDQYLAATLAFKTAVVFTMVQ